MRDREVGPCRPRAGFGAEPWPLIRRRACAKNRPAKDVWWDSNMRLVKMRGPTAYRGLQFSAWDSTELLQKLQEATRTLDQLDNLRRFPSTAAASAAVTQLSSTERAQLRKE